MQQPSDKALTQPVNLWLIDLAKAGPALRKIEQSDPRLPKDQRAEIMASANPAHRNKRLAAHIALRLALERVEGRQAVAGVPFETTPSGKLGLPGGGPEFSISYARDHLLIGINRRGLIGVDLERPRTTRLTTEKLAGIMAVAKAFCPGQPLRTRGGQIDDDDSARFLQSWTRMEAVAKATGQGIISLLGAFGLVGAGKQSRPRDAATVAEFIESRGLSVADIDIPARHPDCLPDQHNSDPIVSNLNNSNRDAPDRELADVHFAAIALGGEGIDRGPAVWLPSDIEALCSFATGAPLSPPQVPKS